MTIGQISDLETAKNVKVVNSTSGPVNILYAGAEVDTAHVAAPGANAQAQVTFAAVAGSRHMFEYVAWSYDDDPTGGNLTIHDGAGNTWFNIDITSKGPGFIPFTPEMSPVGSALYVTLTAGGAGISGKVNVMGHRLG